MLMCFWGLWPSCSSTLVRNISCSDTLLIIIYQICSHWLFGHMTDSYCSYLCISRLIIWTNICVLLHTSFTVLLLYVSGSDLSLSPSYDLSFSAFVIISISVWVFVFYLSLSLFSFLLFLSLSLSHLLLSLSLSLSPLSLSISLALFLSIYKIILCNRSVLAQLILSKLQNNHFTKQVPSYVLLQTGINLWQHHYKENVLVELFLW